MKNKTEVKDETSRWFLVTNTPGVDIRHKVNGQELILVENVNYQIANKIIRAVNSHEALLSTLQAIARGCCLRQINTENKCICYPCIAQKAIAQAEGK